MKNQFKRVLSVLLTIMLLFSIVPAGTVVIADPAGSTYYVSVDGDAATATGAEDAPFATVAAGVEKLAAGDTLIIKEGTYAEALVLDGKLGTANTPIAIKAQGNVTIKGIASKAYSTVCSIANSAYINITGINFMLDDGGVSVDRYPLILNKSSDITVSHCTLNSVSGGATGMLRFIDSTDCTLDSTYATGAERITYQWGGTLSNCTFTNNVFVSHWGFDLDGNGVYEGCKFYNNVFKIGSEGAFRTGSMNECVVANNVFYTANGATMDASANTFAYNAYVAGTPVSSTDFTVADPKFTNADSGDFSLQSDSPLIGAGSSKYMPERDYTGKLRRAPSDVGAYAYNTVYYVDGSVSTTGDGSEATPFKTIAEGVAGLNPGDLLVIKAGTYAESMSIADKGDSSKLPITIRGEGNVVVTGTDYIHNSSWGTSYECVLRLENANNIAISGITFHYSPVSAMEYGSTMIAYKSSAVLSQNQFLASANAASCVQPDVASTLTFDRNTIGGESASGFWIPWGMNNATITNNIVTNAKGFNIGCCAGYPGWQGASSGNKIINNTFVGGFVSSADADKMFTGNTIQNNIFGAACENLAAYVVTDNTFANNCYNVTDEASVGKTLGSGEFVGDPGFKDAANGDYSLKEVENYQPKGNLTDMPELDFAGNTRKTADVGAYAYMFEATIPMAVTAKTPDADKTGVRVTLPITITFSDSVDLSAAPAGSSITVVKQSDSSAVSGTFTVSKNVVTFTPSANLEYETTYVVTIAATVASKAGQQLGSVVSWQFTTGEDNNKPTTYYVAEDGDDSNPGTIDQPVKNASSLINDLKAGDEVVYRQGTYDGIFVLQKKDFSGGDPVTFRSYAGEQATLTSSHANYIFHLGNVRNVRFENLTFSAYENATDNRGPAIDLVNYDPNAANNTGKITVTNCTFINCSPAVQFRDVNTSGKDFKAGELEISNNMIIGNIPNKKINSGLFFWECRVEDGSYAKIYNNVIINAAKSLYFFGRSENLLIYNNTCMDTYDQLNTPGEYDIYAYGGAYNTSLYSPDLFHNCVFKNNIFTKPIRIQKEYDTTVLEAQQNNTFDYNVYASNSMKNYVTYGGGGEGPQMSFADLQQYKGWYGTGAGEKVLGYEANGVYAPVEFVDVEADARLSGSDNPAIGAATDTIVDGVSAPTTDITGAVRSQHEAGAYAFDPTLVFVGENSGTETGSASKPYSSIKNAIAAGGTNIVVKPGTYEEDGLSIPAGTTVNPYAASGSVVLNGAVTVNGGSIHGVVFHGVVSVTGDGSSVTNSVLDAALTLNGAANSIISANDIKAGVVLNGDSNTRFQNNVVSGATTGVLATDSTGLKIYNNTFAKNTKDLILNNAAATVRNNIFSSENTLSAGVDSDYNCYNSTTLSSDYLASITEANSVKANPEFINAKAEDYRLHKLSACVGAGAADSDTPTTDKNGVSRTGSDIGAYALVKVDNVYYVSTEGDDNAAGTKSAPFKTIAQAISVLRAGEKVVVMDGEYSENLTIMKSFDQADSFVIAAQNPGKVTVKGNIAIVDSNNVTMNGINVDNKANAVVINNSTNIKLSSGTVTGSAAGLMAANSTVSLADMKILVSGTGLVGTTATLNVTRTLFKGNMQAISATNNSDLTVTASVFASCSAGIYSNGESDLRAVNNSFWNVAGLNVDVAQTDGNESALDLYNNIYSRDNGSGLFVSINKGWGFNSENNIYNAAERDKLSAIQGEARTLAELQAGGDDTASILGDPMYTDPANDNFSPAKGSPVARAGRNDANAPSISFNGLAFAEEMDIGAYYSPFTLRTFHVCPYGIGWGWYDQAPDGSWDRPFTSLKQALAVVGSSDTIIVHKGVYDEGRIDIVDLHGTEDARITIKGCDDPDCWYCQKYDSNSFDYAPAEPVSIDRPVFTGKQKYDYDDTTVSASSDLCMKFTDCSYITVENLEIAGFTDCGVWIYGGEGMELKNLKLHNFDNKANVNAGVMGVLANDAVNCLFKDLTIWDIGYTRRSEADHGMYIGYADNCTFENLVIYQSPGAGIQFYAGDNYKIHATNCTIKNSVFVECCDGLIMCGTQGFNVVNNTFVNSLANDLYLDWNVNNCNFQNNLFYNDFTEANYPYDRPTSIVGRHNGSGENKVLNNTFTNCIYDYAGPARCQEGWSLDGFADVTDFIAAQQGLNTFRAFNPGSAVFAGTIDTNGTTPSDQAVAIRDNAIFKILWLSDCVDAGLAENAPATDILGGNRTGLPDIGAYEADPVVEYHFTQGNNSSWTQGSANGLEFKLDGPVEKLGGFLIDGTVVTVDDGALSDDGSTLTLNSTFLGTLSVGKHEIYALYSDGYATAAFTVIAKGTSSEGGASSEGGNTSSGTNSGTASGSNPSTGVNGTFVVVVSIFLSAAAIAALCIALRRRKEENN